MKRILLTIFLVLLCVADLYGIYYIYQRIDQAPPFVLVQKDSSAVCRSGITIAELLDDVKAIDEKSGDVSHTLTVESITPGMTDDVVTIVYAAVDKGGNKGRVSYTMPVAAGESATAVSAAMAGTLASQDQAEAGEASAQPSAADGNAEAPAEPGAAVSEVPDAAAANTETADGQPMDATLDEARQTQEAKMDQISDEAPHLYLKNYYQEIPSGSTFDKNSYIERIEDDIDSQESLMERVITDGYVDMNVPGAYNITYYVMDSSGHQSNMATLTLRVL